MADLVKPGKVVAICADKKFAHLKVQDSSQERQVVDRDLSATLLDLGERLPLHVQLGGELVLRPSLSGAGNADVPSDHRAEFGHGRTLGS